MHHDAKRALVLVLVLVSAHLPSSAADDEPAPAGPIGRPGSSGDAAVPPNGGPVGQPRGQPAPDGAVSSQAAAPDPWPAVTAPDADALVLACAAPTLEDWALRHGRSAVCHRQLGDDGEAGYSEDTLAAASPIGTANVTEAAASAEQPPVPEAAVKEQLEVGDEERQNFAAAKDGAKIVAANKEAKKAASLLDDDGDTFLKNECKAEKWVIIELAQMVKVDTIKVSQFELYSSRIKDFQLRARLRHPRSDGSDYAKSLDSPNWQLLGNFTAAKTKGTQTFKVTSSPWVKFLQLRFLTHYGIEPVCAVNDITVLGRGANEDLEELLSTDPEVHVPVVAPLVTSLPAVPLAPTEQPAATAPQLDAAAGAEQGVTHTALGAVVQNGSHAADAGLAVDRQNEAANTAASASHADEAVASEPKAPTATEGTARSGGDSNLSGLRTEPLPLAHSSGPSVPAELEPSTLKQNADAAGTLPTVTIVEAPAQPDAAKTAAAGGPTAPVSHNGALPAQHPLAPAATAHRPAAAVHVAADPSSGASAQLKLAASTGDPAPTRAAARAELEFGELPVGSGRSGGGIYDVLVQELKAIKVQQKAVPRQLAEMQAEAAAAVAAANSASAAVSAASERIGQLETARGNSSNGMAATAGQFLRVNDPLVEALQQRLVAAERRQTAMLGALAMLAGFLALDKVHFVDGGRRRLFHAAVVVLSLANGAVGLASLLLSVKASSLLY